MAQEQPDLGMDFGKEALKCAYPECEETQAQPGVAGVAPFCTDHLREWKFVRFVLANSPIRMVQQPPPPVHGGLIVPGVVAPRDVGVGRR